MYHLLKCINLHSFLPTLVMCFLLSSAQAATPEKTDPALDSNFEVSIRNGYSYCVAPSLSSKDNTYYAYELARDSALDCIGHDWRYDVHGHISTLITDDENNERYLCMTDTATSNRDTYYYIELHPCSVNNVRQIWKYNDNTEQMVNQHTGNRLQEINWYLATAANSAKLYDLKVTGRKIIFALVPAPFTLAYDFNFHYSFNGQSFTRILGKDGKISSGKLRYHPDTKQITAVLSDGNQYCLRSNMIGSSKDSEFISFQQCPDRYADGIVPQPLKWNITTSTSGKNNNRIHNLIITDIKGNYFGVERAGGILIGTGYTIKPNAVSKIPDLFKPLYLFHDGGETASRKRYFWGNYLGSLRPGICPSPGVFTNPPEDSLHTNQIQPRLPHDFSLVPWITRLFSITTHNGGEQFAGICGACLVHAVEMILEMHRHGNTPPATSLSPQLFSLDESVTTMTSFQQRFPALYNQFTQRFTNQTNHIYDQQNGARDAILFLQDVSGDAIANMIGGSGLSLSSSIYFNQTERLGATELQQMLTEMRNSAIGTQFIAIGSVFNDVTQEVEGHATVFIRTRNGLHAIPTRDRTFTSQQAFENVVMADINSYQGLENALRFFNPQRYSYVLDSVIFSLAPSTATASGVEAFDQRMLSVGNCTIGGAAGGLPGVEHGAGSGLPFASTSDVFQCAPGRCDTSLPQSAANSAQHFTPNWPGQCQWLRHANGRWIWDGNSRWAKRYTTAASCQAANRCQYGGACYRWKVSTRDIGVCQHLWRDKHNGWRWFDYPSHTSMKACQQANRCHSGGACFRWNEQRTPL